MFHINMSNLVLDLLFASFLFYLLIKMRRQSIPFKLHFSTLIIVFLFACVLLFFLVGYSSIPSYTHSGLLTDAPFFLCLVVASAIALEWAIRKNTKK